MMGIQSVRREGRDLSIKGKMMKVMAMSICLRPEDLWESR